MTRNLLEILPPGGYSWQRQVLARFPFSAATLWRKVKTGEFPAPVKLSAGITAWKNDELEQWAHTRDAERS